MCTSSPEAVPQTWDDDRDPAFFRITATLFSSSFTYGAGVLLAGNDPVDEYDVVCRCETTSSLPAPASAELVPVRVRRGDRA
jgi:hypothetical protein